MTLFLDKFKAIWKDPVWSKIISVGILTLIAIIWNKLASNDTSQNLSPKISKTDSVVKDSIQLSKESHSIAAADIIIFSKSSSIEDFNTNILKHGYSFAKKAIAASEIYFYSSDKSFSAESNQLVQIPDTVYFMNNALATSVGIKTASKNYYLNLIEQFDKLGYTKDITLRDSTGIMSQYASLKDTTCRLSVMINRSKKGESSWASYFLLFSNINPKAIGLGRTYK